MVYIIMALIPISIFIIAYRPGQPKYRRCFSKMVYEAVHKEYKRLRKNRLTNTAG